MDQIKNSPLTEANLLAGGGGTVGGLAGGSQAYDTTGARGAQESILLATGRRYHALGLNVIPTGQDKRPARVTPDRASPHLAWEKWKTDRQAPADLAGLPWPQAASLAAICGPVSAGLVCLDFDDKEQAHGQELGPVRAVLGALGLPADYGWLVTTPRGGGVSGVKVSGVRCRKCGVGRRRGDGLRRRHGALRRRPAASRPGACDVRRAGGGRRPRPGPG